jgi:hypothetical protein
MFDNLRDDSSAAFFEGENPLQPDAGLTDPPLSQPPRKFLGLTPIQRFILSVLIMIMTCIFGLACSIVTGNMVP